MTKLVLTLLAALLLSSAAPLPTPPALPPARIVVHRSSSIVRPQPRSTPAVTIVGVVTGYTSYGSPAPIGSFIAYGSSLSEALTNAQAHEAEVRAMATAAPAVLP